MRARCGCTWWIATRRQIGSQLCRHCGVRFMVATEKDFAAMGISTVVVTYDKKRKK